MGKSFADRIKAASKELLGTAQQTAKAASKELSSVTQKKPAPSPSPAPKSNKMGSVKKCPNCGATVQSYQGKCPECGYTFEGTDANSAVKALNEALQQENSKIFLSKNPISVIDNFPIPSDKATLLNFITWLEPQSKHKDEELGDAYYRKYTECVKKAQVIFPNDPDFEPFVSGFAKGDKKRANAKTKRKILTNQWTWIGLVVLLIALIVLFFILKPKPIQKNLERSSAAIEKAIKNGDTEKATEIFLAFEGNRNYSKRDLYKVEAEPLISACLKANNFTDVLRIKNKAHLYSNDLVKIFDPYVNDCLAKKDFDNARQAAEILDDYNIKNKVSIKQIEYYISREEFDLAKEVCQNHNEKLYGTYIKDVVIHLCEQGQKQEAQKFLNRNINLVVSNDVLKSISQYRDPVKYGSYEEQDRANVKKQIQDVINSYK